MIETIYNIILKHPISISSYSRATCMRPTLTEK